MKGRTNCGFSGGGGNIKYIPSCATLTILSPADATVQVSKGSFSKQLDSTYKDKIVDIYDVYKYYVKPSEFGTWSVTIAFDETSRVTTIVVDETKEYKINTVLPVEYQHVQYIGGSDDAAATRERINTETIPTDKTCVSIHYLILPGVDYSTRTWSALFGSNGVDGEHDSFKVQLHSAVSIAQVGINGSYTELSKTGLDSGKHFIKLDLKRGIGINDGITYQLQLDSLEFTTPLAIIRAQDSSSSAFYGKPYAQTQDFKIYEDDVLIQYFIPCYRRSDSVIGMYELINDQFYITSGTTGGFTKGPDLTF